MHACERLLQVNKAVHVGLVVMLRARSLAFAVNRLYHVMSSLPLVARWSADRRRAEDGTAHLPEAMAVAVGSDRRSTPAGPLWPGVVVAS